jgi:hypothetical protein
MRALPSPLQMSGTGAAWLGSHRWSEDSLQTHISAVTGPSHTAFSFTLRYYVVILCNIILITTVVIFRSSIMAKSSVIFAQ